MSWRELPLSDYGVLETRPNFIRHLSKPETDLKLLRLVSFGYVKLGETKCGFGHHRIAMMPYSA